MTTRFRRRPESGLDVQREVVFLVNPGAGGGRTEARLGRLLARHRATLPRHRTAPVRSLDDVARILDGLDPRAVPVAAGGDGTLGLVAAGLDACGRADLPVSILPLGTGNIVAKNVGLREPEACFAALARGRVIHLDVMRTSRPEVPASLVAISAGCEGHFIHHWDRWRSRGRPLAGIVAGIRAWRHDDTIELDLDGRTVLPASGRSYAAGLYNTPNYIAGLVMLPEADPADGVVESVVYRSRSAYLRATAAGLAGRARTAPGYAARRPWRTARLVSDGPIQIDGESLSPGEVAVRMDAGGLPLLVPAA